MNSFPGPWSLRNGAVVSSDGQVVMRVQEGMSVGALRMVMGIPRMLDLLGRLRRFHAVTPWAATNVMSEDHVRALCEIPGLLRDIEPPGSPVRTRS